jgi:hypothetical protein
VVAANFPDHLRRLLKRHQRGCSLRRDHIGYCWTKRDSENLLQFIRKQS